MVAPKRSFLSGFTAIIAIIFISSDFNKRKRKNLLCRPLLLALNE